MQGLISADWHLRADKPRCRLDDDWEETQRATVEHIITIANKRNTDLFIVGDLFDTPVVPMRLVVMLIEELSKIKQHVYFIAGNHDLPYHSSENINNSAIGILNSMKGNHLKITGGSVGIHAAYANFGDEIVGDKHTKKLFLHTLVFPNTKSIPPNCEAVTASQLLAEHKWADWIFTGDMHTGFHYEKDERHVVNPGCILRQAADMVDYKPIMYYVNTEKNIVEEIELPDTGEMVTDSYLRAEEERDDRITAFVEGIKRGEKISLSIVDNIKNAIKKNKKTLEPSIICMIEKLVEESV